MTGGGNVEPAAFLTSLPQFAGLEEKSRNELAEAFDEVGLSAGQVLVCQGQPDPHLYLVVEGALELLAVNRRHEHQILAQLKSGEMFGEMSILSDDSFPATLRAAEPSRVARLSRDAYRRFAAENPVANLHIVPVLSLGVQRKLLIAALHTSDLFTAPDPAAIRELAGEMELQVLRGGEVLFEEHQPASCMWFVVSGRLHVSGARAARAGVEVLEIDAGKTVGEMALLGRTIRDSRVQAIRDTQLGRLSADAFERFLRKHPRTALDLVGGSLAGQLATSHQDATHPATSVCTIAVVPAGEGAPLREAAAQVANGLRRLGAVLHLNSETVDRHLGADGVSQAWEGDGRNVAILQWLAKQEFENRFVVYESDSWITPWTERCLRQADRIVMVAAADGGVALNEIEAEFIESPQERARGREHSLVIVHPDSTALPSGTARWLAQRTPNRHHHVRLSQPADFERVARFLTGRALGIALGGGFARGLAHIGVVRAFAELGIPVDAIGGSSMGAIIGAQIAIGRDLDRVLQETCEGCAASFGDLTFPFVAFQKGKKFSDLVHRLLGNVRIEDMWRPFFCVSANLNIAEQKVHTHGGLARSALASTRAPGVFPPVVLDGHLHVDGGVLNNVPVDVMKNFVNGGYVMGVDVSPPHELNDTEDYGDGISGFGAAWRRFSPWASKKTYVPSILLIMMRTIEFGGVSYKNSRLDIADVYMRPALLRFKRTDFHAAGQIAQAGFDCAVQELSDWRDKSPNLPFFRPDLAAPRVTP